MSPRIEALPPLHTRRAGAEQPPRWGRRIGWLALAAAAVGATLVACLPAAWLADSVATRSGQRVLLADAGGTLWRGSATLALSAGVGSQNATVLPGRVQWSLAFWPLFTGHARLTVRHDLAMPAPATLDAAPAGWSAEAGSIALPASLLEGIGAPFNTLKLDGRMRVSWSQLQGNRTGCMQCNVNVELEQVSSSLSRLRPLGSYRAVVDWSGNGGTLRLSTLQGPLMLDGTGTLGRNARFEGTADAAPDAAAQLIGLLSLLGKREGNITRLRF